MHNTRVWIFLHPGSKWYRANPDTLGPVGLLLEIKTRAVNSSGPLESLKECKRISKLFMCSAKHKWNVQMLILASSFPTILSQRVDFFLL